MNMKENWEAIRESHEYQRGYSDGYKEGLAKGMEEATKQEKASSPKVLVVSGGADPSILRKLIEESMKNPGAVVSLPEEIKPQLPADSEKAFREMVDKVDKQSERYMNRMSRRYK